MTEPWPDFVSFIKSELASGGPDPQIELLRHLSRDATPTEKVWLAGCYGSHHCVPSAYAVWKTFRPGEFENDALERWLLYNWDKLPVRPEMRSHRMVEKRVRCLSDFSAYALSQRWVDSTFDELWSDSQREVKYYGRYMAIKFVEILHRLLDNPKLKSYDIRATQAWSPRKTLGLLFPTYADTVGNRHDNSDSTVAEAEAIADSTLVILKKNDITISHFQLQVMLCEYKEFRSNSYYAGASHDEEYDYIKTVEQGFDMSDVWKARQACFQPQYLKELRNA